MAQTNTKPMPKKEEQPLPSAEQVKEFLQANPAFFREQEELLSKLKLPMPELGNNVSSMQGFQVKKLQRKVETLEKRIEMLIRTSLENTESEKEINRLTLHLLQAKSLEEMRTYLMEEMAQTLDLQSVALQTDNFDSNLFEAEQTVLLRASQAEDETHSGKTVSSEARILLRNNQNKPLGVLVMGSENPSRFYEGQGTELLEFLGAVLAHCLMGLQQNS